ncbi:hypothetical protein [Enterobacter hormaechei]|uniref:hypothetical protein n=1 Tax=Enterobacter hormaechei TaxID=158836 RepID=UPI0034D2065C
MRNLTSGDDLENTRNQQWHVEADFNISSPSRERKDEGKKMEQPEVHIKNEPKFIDHHSPHCYPMPGGYGCGDGFGFGGGAGGGLLLGALLGRGLLGGGWGHGHDGGHNCERAVFDASILSKLGTIEGAVPLVGSQTQTAIATSTGLINTNALQVALSNQQQISAVAFANQAQVSGVKDAVQTGTFATAIGIRDDGDKTRALITANENAALNRQLGVLETTLLLERQRNCQLADTHGLVIQNTNTANAMQQQQQQQGFQVSRLLDMIHCCDQNIRATNQAINIGSGAQVATPNNTSTNNRVN